MKQRLACDLEVSGDYYAGTALQAPGTPTLHRHLQDCIRRLAAGCEPSLQCCSRLDAGVAAASFPIHCDIPEHWLAADFARALNAGLGLPQRQRHATIWRYALVNADWDAWRSTKKKVYRYEILQRRTPPLSTRRCLWLRRDLDWDCLCRCAELLIGRHDLSGFACLRGDASDHYHPQRHIFAAGWEALPESQGGRLLRFTISGEGFLYKQVRGLVGAMLRSAQNKPANTQRFAQVIAEGRAAPRLGEIIPAKGLSLMQVDYEDREPAWNLLD